MSSRLFFSTASTFSASARLRARMRGSVLPVRRLPVELPPQLTNAVRDIQNFSADADFVADAMFVTAKLNRFNRQFSVPAHLSHSVNAFWTVKTVNATKPLSLAKFVYGWQKFSFKVNEEAGAAIASAVLRKMSSELALQPIEPNILGMTFSGLADCGDDISIEGKELAMKLFLESVLEMNLVALNNALTAMIRMKLHWSQFEHMLQLRICERVAVVLEGGAEPDLPRRVSQLIYSLGKLKASHASFGAAFIALLIEHFRSVLKNLTAQEFTNAIFGWSRMGTHINQLPLAVQEGIYYRAAVTLKVMTEQELSVMLLGFGSMGVKFSDLSLAFLNELRGVLQHVSPRFTAEGLAVSLKGLALMDFSFGETLDESTEERLLLALDRLLPLLSKQQLLQTLDGLKNMNFQVADREAAFLSAAKRVANKNHLSMMEWVRLQESLVSIGCDKENLRGISKPAFERKYRNNNNNNNNNNN